jgi:Uma2 family endonuclease
MPEPARKRATYEDVLAAPRDRVAEIVDGRLHTHPRPALRHAMASSKLGNQLGPAFYDGDGGPGGWIILDEPELHLADDILVPDLAGWRTERMPNVPDAPYTDLPPDWICEVLSASTAAFDRTEKLRVYARERVHYGWLIDPKLRTLEVLELDTSVEPPKWRIAQVVEGTNDVRAVPFDAIELKLGRLWGL